MKTEQAAGFTPIAHGRLITQSQWDGSAFRLSGQEVLPVSERGEGIAATGAADPEGTTAAAT